MGERLASVIGLHKEIDRLRQENAELRVTNDELYGKVLQMQAWVQMLQQELEETRAERDSHGIGY